MVLRWCAAGMSEAARQFRRVKGYRQLPMLRAPRRHRDQPDTPATYVSPARSLGPSPRFHESRDIPAFDGLAGLSTFRTTLW